MDRYFSRLMILPACLLALVSCGKDVPAPQAFEKYLRNDSRLKNTGWEFYTSESTASGLRAYIIFPERKPGISRIAPVKDELMRLCPDSRFTEFWKVTGLKSIDLLLIRNVDLKRGKAKKLVQVTCNDDFDLIAFERSTSADYKHPEPETEPSKYSGQQKRDTANLRAEWFSEMSKAVAQNDITNAKKLLEARPMYVNMRDEKKNTFLHNTKSPEITRLLIEKKARVDATNEKFFTPLHYAATLPDTAVAEVLLNNRANVNRKNTYDATPISMAKNKAMVRLLVKHGAALNKTELYMAVTRQNLELAKAFHELGIDVNQRAGANSTPLHAIAFQSSYFNHETSKKNTEIFQWLIDNGADINAQDKYGRTPYDMVMSVHKPDPAVLNILKRHGGKLNKQK